MTNRGFVPVRAKKSATARNNQGMITMPFLVVLCIVLFFVFSLFGLAMTFVHISVSQYLSYSTARKLSLGGITQADQKDQAVQHYATLRGRFFSPQAHQGGTDWFLIDSQLDANKNLGFTGAAGRYTDSHPYRNMFYGAGLNFSSNRLVFKIPFLVKGATPSGLSNPARVLSFLGREPSQTECEDQFNKDKVKTHICSAYSLPSPCEVSKQENLRKKGDNGC